MHRIPNRLRSGVVVGLAAWSVMQSAIAMCAEEITPRQVVDKAIERMWGEKFGKFNAMTTRMKGSLKLNGADIAFVGDVSGQNGDQQKIAIDLNIDGQTIAFAEVYNRGQGWEKVNDDVMEMDADKLKDARNEAHANWVSMLLPLKGADYKLAPFGEVEVNGRKAVGVGVTREGYRAMTLFFDKENYDLVRSESVVRGIDLKEAAEEVTYSNFKASDGVRYAAKLAIKRDGQSHVDAEIEDFKVFDKFDDSLFAKP